MMPMLLSRDEQGATRADLEGLARREPFSRFLPYLAFDRESGEYLNADDSIGLLWECSPLAFLSDTAAEHLAGLLRQPYPEQTLLQFILYPDEDISGVLDTYTALRTRRESVVQAASQRYAAHLRGGVHGLTNLTGIPVRNFRLFVAVKSLQALPTERIALIEESLAASGLAPVRMPAATLVAWLRRLFNAHVPTDPAAIDEARYLRNQIIDAETAIGPFDGGLHVGNRLAACLTPKSLPDGLGTLDVNRLLGGFSGRQDDAGQLMHRFLWTTTVYFRTRAADIRRKASVMMAQRVSGTIARTLGRRVSELNWVLDEVEHTPYCNVMTAFWLFADDPESLEQAVARARLLWEKQHFVMQRETAIAAALFIASLPFGLYTGGPSYPNVALLDRDFPMSVNAATRLLPVQGDFAGGMRPVLLYVGRKGQLVSVDVFDPGANNHNFLVCAGSGAGKSFSTNFLCQSYYATGALMRIVDIGYSYQKQAMVVGGRFIDVGDPKLGLVLNPFSSLGGDAADQAANRATTAQILLSMIWSGTGTSTVTETELSLVKAAVAFAYARDGGERGIDHVREYLRTYPHKDDPHALPQLVPLAHEMAFNLADFTSTGRYGALFNGRSTFDIASDPFVVLELERLLNDEELFRVVALQVLNAITQDLYLSDRSSRRFMLFDEAWKYLVIAGESGASAAPAIAKIIQEGYRRARKYGGATGIVTQSPLDLGKMGPAGEVIKANAAYKFWLQCDAEEWSAAAKRDIVSYQGLTLDLAISVRNNRPRYSEMLIDTPFGIGVGRLAVDPWTYWMNTSAAEEYARFSRLLRAGYTPLDALDLLAAEG